MAKSNPDLDELEREIHLLRVEFDKYFNGALDLPPHEPQNRLRIKIRNLRGQMRLSIDKFRLNTLEARFNSYGEMFNRRVRDIEEGRVVRRRGVDASPRVNVQEGVMVSGRIDETAAAALYQGLYAGTSKADKIDVGKFRGYLDQQARKIRQKTGCAQVQFRVANEGGQLKLKAKPLKNNK